MASKEPIADSVVVIERTIRCTLVNPADGAFVHVYDILIGGIHGTATQLLHPLSQHLNGYKRLEVRQIHAILATRDVFTGCVDMSPSDC